jgi:hypothetical protein
MRIGAGIGAFATEPDHAARRHPVFHGKVRRGREWEALLESRPDVDPDDILIAAEYEAVKGGVESLKRHARAWGYLSSGISEAPLYWSDEPTELRCKALPDVLRPDSIIELKSTNSRNFGRDRLEAHAIRSGWHIQIGHYVMGAKANGFPIARAVLIVVESEPPFDCAIFRLRRELVQLGMEQCRRALDIIAECERSGLWPGIDGGEELELELPASEIPWPPKLASASPSTRRYPNNSEADDESVDANSEGNMTSD